MRTLVFCIFCGIQLWVAARRTTGQPQQNVQVLKAICVRFLQVFYVFPLIKHCEPVPLASRHIHAADGVKFSTDGLQKGDTESREENSPFSGQNKLLLKPPKLPFTIFYARTKKTSGQNTQTTPKTACLMDC